jgi:hypothetical protein
LASRAGFNLGESDDPSLTIADAEAGTWQVSTVFEMEQVAVTVDDVLWEGLRFEHGSPGPPTIQVKIGMHGSESWTSTSIQLQSLCYSFAQRRRKSNAVSSPGSWLLRVRGHWNIWWRIHIHDQPMPFGSDCRPVACVHVSARLKEMKLDERRSQFNVICSCFISMSCHRCLFAAFFAGFTALIKKSGGLAAITKELSGMVSLLSLHLDCSSSLTNVAVRWRLGSC